MLLRERRAQIATAVGRLPERQRTIFLLCHYEGCSSREVSTITGGCVACGAAIGGAVGAATGYVVDVIKKNDEPKNTDQTPPK